MDLYSEHMDLISSLIVITFLLYLNPGVRSPDPPLPWTTASVQISRTLLDHLGGLYKFHGKTWEMNKNI